MWLQGSLQLPPDLLLGGSDGDPKKLFMQIYGDLTAAEHCGNRIRAQSGAGVVVAAVSAALPRTHLRLEKV